MPSWPLYTFTSGFLWLKWLFKNEFQTIVLLLVGKIKVLEEHIRANPQFGRLPIPIQLEQEDEAACSS